MAKFELCTAQKRTKTIDGSDGHTAERVETWRIETCTLREEAVLAMAASNAISAEGRWEADDP